jgi:hypothetical protein
MWGQHLALLGVDRFHTITAEFASKCWMGNLPLGG